LQPLQGNPDTGNRFRSVLFPAMNSLSSIGLIVGDQVRFRASSCSQASGVVVELLQHGYVRVLWDDMSATTTHQTHSLARVISAAQQVAQGRV